MAFKLFVFQALTCAVFACIGADLSTNQFPVRIDFLGTDADSLQEKFQVTNCNQMGNYPNISIRVKFYDSDDNSSWSTIQEDDLNLCSTTPMGTIPVFALVRTYAQLKPYLQVELPTTATDGFTTTNISYDSTYDNIVTIEICSLKFMQSKPTDSWITAITDRTVSSSTQLSKSFTNVVSSPSCKAKIRLEFALLQDAQGQQTPICNNNAVANDCNTLFTISAISNGSQTFSFDVPSLSNTSNKKLVLQFNQGPETMTSGGYWWQTDFYIISIQPTSEALDAYTAGPTVVDVIDLNNPQFFTTGYDHASFPNDVKASVLTYDFSCQTVGSVVQEPYTTSAPPYPYCDQTFSLDIPNKKIKVKNYTRVSGFYDITIVATWPYFTLTGTKTTRITVESDCGQSSVTASGFEGVFLYNNVPYTSGMIIPYTGQVTISFASIVSNQQGCQIMNKNAMFLLKRSSSKYGSQEFQTVATMTAGNTVYEGVDWLTQIAAPFEDQTEARSYFKAHYDSIDPALTSWESSEFELYLKLFKIITRVASETFAVKISVSQAPFSIDASEKFSTNMESTPGYSSHSLVFSFQCVSPVTASNKALASSNDCCSILWKWDGMKITFDTTTTDPAKYCDGRYELIITAHNSLFSSYTAEYRAKVDAKYDCLELKTLGKFDRKDPGLIYVWPPGSTAANYSQAFFTNELSFTIGTAEFDIASAVAADGFWEFSCQVQYKFTCPQELTNCQHFDECFQAGLSNADMKDIYLRRSQLRIKQSTNHLAMSFNNQLLQTDAYIYSSDDLVVFSKGSEQPVTSTAHYDGNQNFLAKISWTFPVKVTKNCIPSLLVLCEKADDPDAQVSSTRLAALTINQMPVSSRSLLVNKMDTTDEMSRIHCLGDFTSFQIDSTQVLNLQEIFTIESLSGAGGAPISPKITLIAEANIKVQNIQTYCKLSYYGSVAGSSRQQSCQVTVNVNALIDSLSFPFTQITIEVKNECLAIDTNQIGKWSFSGSQTSNFVYPYTYDIWHGSTPTTKRLPMLQPQLYSQSLTWYTDASGVISFPSASIECGAFIYSIGNQITLEVASIDPSPTSSFPDVVIQSTNPVHSGQNESTDYKRSYLLDLTATFADFPEVKFAYTTGKTATQPPLEFFMQDRCIGMYFDEPYIDANRTDQAGNQFMVQFQNSETSKVYYHLKAPKDYFFVQRITPYQYTAQNEAPMKVEGKCGPIKYYPKPSPSFPKVVTWDMAQINPAVIFSQDKGLEFAVYSEMNNDEHLGDVKTSLQIKSTYSSLYQKGLINLVVNLRPCWVYSVNSINEKQSDFELPVGLTINFVFTQFIQEPNCGYDWTYTLTTRKVKDFKDPVDFDKVLQANKEGISPYEFGQIEGMQIKMKTIDQATIDLTYASFITGTCQVSSYQSPIKLWQEIFRFKVKPADFTVKNKPPSIKNFDSFFELQVPQTKHLVIGQLLDDNTQDETTLCGLFMTCDNRNTWFTLPPMNRVIREVSILAEIPEDAPNTSCTASLTVCDNDPSIPLRSTFDVTVKVFKKFEGVTISEQKQTPQTEQASQMTLKVTKSSINREGVASLKFNKDIQVPSFFYNLTSENEGQNFFKLTLIVNPINIESLKESKTQGDLKRRLQASNDYSFKWQIVEAKSFSELKFDFQFQKPLLISLEVPDKMRIELLKSDVLISSQSQATFEPQEVVLPKLIGSKSEADTMQGISSTVESAMTFVFTGNIVITAFASVAMYFLWGMINGLQLIALTCLFKIRLPANVMQVNLEILQVAAFDFFQSDVILQAVFNFTETPSFSQDFEEASFGGSNFIIGNGPMFLFMVGYIIFLLTRWFIISQYGEEKYACKCTTIVPWFQSHNVESTSIRFVLEGSIDIFFWCLISLFYAQDANSIGEKVQDKFSTVFAIAMSVLLAYSPIHALIRAIQFRKLLRQEKTKTWFQKQDSADVVEEKQKIKEATMEIFSDFKQDLPSLLYFLFFLTRRMIMVLTLVIMQNYGNFQVSIYVVMSCANLVYLIQVRPYEEEMINIQEIINELFILCSSYFMLIFSDWISNTETLTWTDLNLKSTMGLVMLIMLILCVLINIAIVVYSVVISFKAKLRAKNILKMNRKLNEHKERVRQKQIEQEETDRRLAEAVQEIINSSESELSEIEEEESDEVYSEALKLDSMRADDSNKKLANVMIARHILAKTEHDVSQDQTANLSLLESANQTNTLIPIKPNKFFITSSKIINEPAPQNQDYELIDTSIKREPRIKDLPSFYEEEKQLKEAVPFPEIEAVFDEAKLMVTAMYGQTKQIKQVPQRPIVAPPAGIFQSQTRNNAFIATTRDDPREASQVRKDTLDMLNARLQDVGSIWRTVQKNMNMKK